MTVPVECAAVVKADAYGCGLEPVAHEARRRPAARRSSSPISPKAAACARSRRRPRSTCSTGSCPAPRGVRRDPTLRPVISSTTELAEWDAFVAAHGWRGGAALHVDTGMNRLGIAPRRRSRSRRALQIGESRLHAADEPPRLRRDAGPSAERQARSGCFAKSACTVPRRCPPRSPIRPAFSSAARSHCDLVRPGRRALRRQSDAGTPQSRCGRWSNSRAASSQVRNVETRRHASATARAGPPARRRRIAMVAVGYADGYLRSASAAKTKPAAQAIVAGKRCPIVGRVSMDLMAVDVTDLPRRRGRGAATLRR